MLTGCQSWIHKFPLKVEEIKKIFWSLFRQTLMFSATFPDDIQTAAQDFLNDYLFLTMGMVGGACSDVQQEFYEVAKFDKREKLEELMQDPARGPLIFVQVIWWLWLCQRI